MTSQLINSVENNFTKGLITEFTGLNFPENAATDTSNCEYTLVGDVIRREGINTELNGTTTSVTTASKAIADYVWNNPGGDGNSKLLVEQVGPTLFFYNIATSTVASPLSTKALVGTIDVSANVVSGQVFDATSECQFSDGNGYLFVYQKTCDPFYVTYNASTLALASFKITVQVRDFTGVVDGLPVSVRPTILTVDHQYNLQNQGWTSGNPWFTTAFGNIATGSNTYSVDAGLGGVSLGQLVSVTFSGGLGGSPGTAAGTVTAYSGTSMTLNIISISPGAVNGVSITITPFGTGYISTWKTAEGNYPSNADVWWYFKNSSGAFDPATTAGNVTISIGNAPQGHYIFNAFQQDRTSASGLQVTNINTAVRPTTGTWFQGRVWYTGVNSFQAAGGDANFYTWTENIYFSQIVSGISDFGLCYQTNDPTSETLNGLLPTDGGVITIVGSGSIHKLWPVANGLLVFANNGVWFITGSQGIGFAANDYTITKISSIKVLSSKSFVDVLGLPFFWNEEGIYQVQSGQQGQLMVEPITVGTILSYYNAIPLASKKYARGAYDPIDYRIQWVFKTTAETNVTSRYQFDSILNYNTYNKAFYPYTLSSDGIHSMAGIVYVSYPYLTNTTPEPGFKYPVTTTSTISFAEEYDTTFVDWGSANYVSYFVTGYKVHGKGLFKFQVPYIQVFSRNIANYIAYYVQGIWNYATSTNSGQYSTKIFAESFDTNHGVSFRRHKIRGRGYTLQLKFTSVDGQPFDFIGWATFEALNSGV